MRGDERKVYESLEFSSKLPKKQIKIPGNRKYCISYFSSGQIQIKEEIYSCEFCYDGNFINCDDCKTGPKAQVHMVRNPSGRDFDDWFWCKWFWWIWWWIWWVWRWCNFWYVRNELLTHTEFSYTIDVGQIIAIYSSQTVKEPLFLSSYVNSWKNTQMNDFWW